MKKLLPALATLLALALFGPPSAAATTPASPAQVVQERLILIQGVHQILVLDRLVLGPHSHALYWAPPGGVASAEPRSAGAVWLPKRKAFLISPRARQVTLFYLIDSVGAGLSIPWQRSLPVKELWVYTGPGVNVPIELNQYLYAQGTSWLNGTEFVRANAADLPAGPLRLNIEVDPPPPPVFYDGFWILLGGALIWVASLWWSRMPRRSREVD
jgi:hypothetical protein